MGTRGGSAAAAGFLLWADVPTWSLQEGACFRAQHSMSWDTAQWDSLHPLLSTATTEKLARARPPGPQLQGSVEGPGKWLSIYWWHRPNNSGCAGVVTTIELYRLLTAGNG